jgi:hypothetical protein
MYVAHVLFWFLTDLSQFSPKHCSFKVSAFFCYEGVLANFESVRTRRTKAISNATRKHVPLPAPLVFFLRAMPFPLMKPWRKSLLVAAVLGFAGYVTLFVAPRRDMISQRSNSSRALAQSIRGEDRNFLDDLVQKQKQDNHYVGNPLPDQNIDRAGTIVPSPIPAPRAELVFNTEIVRRGVLVAHSGTLNSSFRPFTP